MPPPSNKPMYAKINEGKIVNYGFFENASEAREHMCPKSDEVIVIVLGDEHHKPLHHIVGHFCNNSVRG